MLYRVLKLVRFTMKKEGGKFVETMGESGEELRSFEKFWTRAQESKKGPKKGPQTFSEFRIFKILRFSKLLCASVDVGVFIAYLWRQKM